MTGVRFQRDHRGRHVGGISFITLNNVVVDHHERRSC